MDNGKQVDSYWLRMWQPIETAPRDGTRILLCEVSEGGYVFQGFWDREPEDENGQCWRNDNPDWERCNPVYWMPLPDPPKIAR